MTMMGILAESSHVYLHNDFTPLFQVQDDTVPEVTVQGDVKRCTFVRIIHSRRVLFYSSYCYNAVSADIDDSQLAVKTRITVSSTRTSSLYYYATRRSKT